MVETVFEPLRVTMVTEGSQTNIFFSCHLIIEYARPKIARHSIFVVWWALTLKSHRPNAIFVRTAFSLLGPI